MLTVFTRMLCEEPISRRGLMRLTRAAGAAGSAGTDTACNASPSDAHAFAAISLRPRVEKVKDVRRRDLEPPDVGAVAIARHDAEACPFFGLPFDDAAGLLKTAEVKDGR